MNPYQLLITSESRQNFAIKFNHLDIIKLYITAQALKGWVVKFLGGQKIVGHHITWNV